MDRPGVMSGGGGHASHPAAAHDVEIGRGVELWLADVLRLTVVCVQADGAVQAQLGEQCHLTEARRAGETRDHQQAAVREPSAASGGLHLRGRKEPQE